MIMPGIAGEFLTALSMSSASVAAISFFFAEGSTAIKEETAWSKVGKWSWWIHLGSVLGIIVLLFSMIYRHDYRYHYVWEHSSNELPVYYMISCFWEGQEGSFLLWLFWHSILGSVVMLRAKEWRNGVMGVIASIQMILASMILGAYLLDMKIGSSPFILLKDALVDAPIFKTNPDFVPTNGTGLNPLLQNYWMVIHPPTLFLGFASTIIPFAFVFTALLRKKYDDWIKPARPWLIFSVMILGVGIIMGGYWAYETLNFGGYWNWDPVENSSLVPWLTGIAALHSLLIYQKSKSYLRFGMVMAAITFLLVLYSTFLTRSGVLGETSVHTFTDLGLSGQLILLVFIYLIPVVILFGIRWKQIPTKDENQPFWSASFFLTLGVLLFLFSSAEILFSTSLPVFNKIFGTHAAPPAQLQLFYYKWNVWFAVGIGLISGIAQFLWWKNVEKAKLADALFRPFLLAVISTVATIVTLAYVHRPFVYGTEFQKLLETGSFLGYIEWFFLAFTDKILFLSSFFALAANLDIFIGILRKNKKGLKFTGGALSHIGFALMLLGILFSSGYDEVISKNLTPEELKLFEGDEKNDNVLLPLNVQRQIPGYFVTYKGKVQAEVPLTDFQIIEQTTDIFKVKFRDKNNEVFAMELPLNVFIQKPKDTQGHSENHIHPISNPEKAEVNLQYVKDFTEKNLRYIKPQLINNRTKFIIDFINLKDTTESFTVVPESEVNEDMGSILSHPSRKIYAGKDIYVHVSSIPNPKETEMEPQYFTLNLQQGQSDSVAGYKIMLEGVVNLTEQAQKEGQILAAGANLRVWGKDSTYFTNPVYTIGADHKIGMIESDIPPLGLKFAFVKIEPEQKAITIQVEYIPPVNEWVVVKAIEKPMINLLWLGTFVLTFGFGIAIYRRVIEDKPRKKTSETDTGDSL